jgi:type VI secretion system secreted protein VgrG
LQAEEFPQKMVEGISTVPFFLAGYKFTLQNHPRDDANADYVLYEVIHEARLIPEGKEQHLYKNTYRGFPATINFKSPQVTPKPRIFSTQTAKVTGKPGEEIYTEEYGRIKVKFHWDPSDKEDDSTSCWIRVATLWAGQKWGTLFTPRVGQEVVVSFIDGDPDKPLVVGSVYNGENKPPYLPSETTKSTIKTQTSKKGEGSTPGYNELRFDDKKGSEEVYLRAQRDFVTYVQNDQKVTIVGGNRTVILESKGENQEEKKGSQSDDSLTLNNGNKSLKIVKGNYTITLDEGNMTVTCTLGNLDIEVPGGDITMNCSGEFSLTSGGAVSITAGGAMTAKAGGHISASSGGSANVSAGADASLSAGGAIEVTAAGAVAITGGGVVEILGAMVRLNG